MLFGHILIITIIFSGQVENVRLCGKQLADLLITVCERNGGFHTPSQINNGSNTSEKKRALIKFLRPRSRKSTAGVTNSENVEESNTDEEEFTFNAGVVDECCKKPCTFSTLVSYCANNHQQSGNIEVQETLPFQIEGESNEADRNLPEFQMQEISMDESSSSDANAEDVNHQHRPNIGHSDRNRPVFIVLTQTSDDEDRTARKYRI